MGQHKGEEIEASKPLLPPFWEALPTCTFKRSFSLCMLAARHLLQQLLPSIPEVGLQTMLSPSHTPLDSTKSQACPKDLVKTISSTPWTMAWKDSRHDIS